MKLISFDKSSIIINYTSIDQSILIKFTKNTRFYDKDNNRIKKKDLIPGEKYLFKLDLNFIKDKDYKFNINGPCFDGSGILNNLIEITCKFNDFDPYGLIMQIFIDDIIEIENEIPNLIPNSWYNIENNKLKIKNYYIQKELKLYKKNHKYEILFYININFSFKKYRLYINNIEITDTVVKFEITPVKGLRSFKDLEFDYKIEGK